LLKKIITYGYVPGRIISVDGQNFRTASEVKSILESYKFGDANKFVVKRSNQMLELSITLREAK
jgi:PDZ domain-containing secreted protein